MATSPLPALESTVRVPADQVEAFVADGHTLIRGLATSVEVAAYRERISAAVLRYNEETRSLKERDTYARAFLQVTNLWRHDEAVARFSLAERFAQVAADLLGAAQVRIYHDQALFKEPGGGVTPWHQDALYWPLDGARAVTMWMPLVDLAPDMGGLQFALGTHAGGALSSYVISDDSEAYFAAFVRDEGLRVDGPVPMRAGDATFHFGWTLHRAHPNSSRVTREVMAVIYVAEGTCVEEPQSSEQRFDLVTWLPGLNPGEPIASPLNPALLSP